MSNKYKWFHGSHWMPNQYMFKQNHYICTCLPDILWEGGGAFGQCGNTGRKYFSENTPVRIKR